MELGFAAWAYAAGVALTLPLRPAVPALVRALTALPFGVATYVVAGTGLLAAGVPTTVLSVFAVASAGAAATAVVAARRGAWGGGPREWSVLGAGLGLVLALAALFGRLGLTEVTTDSFRYLAFSSLVAQTGGLQAVPDLIFSRRPPFVVLMHTPAAAQDTFLLASPTPLLAVCGAGLTLWMLVTGLRMLRTPAVWGVTAVAGVVVVLASTNRFVYHAFYINGHMAFAVFLLVMVGGLWLAAVREQWQWAALAVPAMVALLLLRVEAPFVVATFLVPVVALRAIPAGWAWSHSGAFAGVSLAWYGGVVATRTQEIFSDWTPVGIVLVSVAVLGLQALTLVPAARRFLPVVPALIVAGALAALAAVTVAEPEHVRQSVDAFVANVTEQGEWGWTWVGLGVPFALALVWSRLPLAVLWRAPLATFLPLVFVASAFRPPYRLGPGDSANRMLMHVLLVVVVYLALSAGAAVARPAHREERAGQPPSRPVEAGVADGTTRSGSAMPQPSKSPSTYS